MIYLVLVEPFIFWKFRLEEQTHGFQKRFREISLCIFLIILIVKGGNHSPKMRTKISKVIFQF